jgi:predicted enzyme related to lactoylglutathione lyase
MRARRASHGSARPLNCGVRHQIAMSQFLVENTIPVLGVRDLARSIEFYRDALGFALEWSAGTVCSVARDGCGIMLQVQEQVCASTVWIGLDSDSIFGEVEKPGVRVIQKPTNQPWAYEMKIADPDGNILWLGAEPKK